MANRRKLTQTERRTIYDKMGGHCAYSGEELAFEDMQVDHVLVACGNSLEGWRKILESTPDTLARDYYTYRQAVRFGTVTPTPKKIVFYFERQR